MIWFLFWNACQVQQLNYNNSITHISVRTIILLDLVSILSNQVSMLTSSFFYFFNYFIFMLLKIHSPSHQFFPSLQENLLFKCFLFLVTGFCKVMISQVLFYQFIFYRRWFDWTAFINKVCFIIHNFDHSQKCTKICDYCMKNIIYNYYNFLDQIKV